MPNWTKDIESHRASLRIGPAREAEIVEELRADTPGLTERMRPLKQANEPPLVAAGTPRSE